MVSPLRAVCYPNKYPCIILEAFQCNVYTDTYYVSLHTVTCTVQVPVYTDYGINECTQGMCNAYNAVLVVLQCIGKFTCAM